MSAKGRPKREVLRGDRWARACAPGTRRVEDGCAFRANIGIL